MTFYEQKLKSLKKNLYHNQDQIKTIIAVRNYIDSNYETDLNMILLSKIMLISKYHLIRLFKRYYGLTPRQYLINKRIEKSKDNLKMGMTVTETCYSIGFSSLGSFSVLFKTKTGKTPAEFRKEQFSRSN
jgi:AraC-like DNA-binding protein